MSLDKFITGTPVKKKKKRSNEPSIEKSFDDSLKTSSQVKSVELPHESTNNQSESELITSNSINNNIIPNNNSELINKEEKDLDIRIFVPELQDKTSYELFQMILDIVHSSPFYSRNKNILAKYYVERNPNLDFDFLVNQLEISIVELYVLLAEIKQDLT